MTDPISPVVKQSNELVSLAVERWPVHEKRVMLAIASTMRDEDPLDAEYRIDARELILTMGATRSEYSKIYTAAEKLLSRQVFQTEILQDGRRHFIGINLFSKIEYTEGEATIIAQPTQAARGFFIGLQKYFTLLPLDEVLNLSTFPTIRLFELLMQFRGTGWRRFPVEEIRAQLGLVEFEEVKPGRQQMKVKRIKYPTSGQLLKHVLKPAAAEITEKTSLKIDEIKQEKPRRKVSAFLIRFHIEEDEKNTPPLWPARKVPTDPRPGPLFADVRVPAKPQPTPSAMVPSAAESEEMIKQQNQEAAQAKAERQRINDALAGLDDEARAFLLARAERRLKAAGVQFIADPQRRAIAYEILQEEGGL